MRANNEVRLRLILQRKRKGLCTAIYQIPAMKNQQSIAAQAQESSATSHYEDANIPQTGWAGAEGQRGRNPEGDLSPELKTTAAMGWRGATNSVSMVFHPMCSSLPPATTALWSPLKTYWGWVSMWGPGKHGSLLGVHAANGEQRALPLVSQGERSEALASKTSTHRANLQEHSWGQNTVLNYPQLTEHAREEGREKGTKTTNHSRNGIVTVVH